MHYKRGKGYSDILGRPNGLKRVHLIDSSCFPTIPAKPITLTAMANSNSLCQWENEELFYSNPLFGECFIIVSKGETAEQKTTFEISPNPLTSNSVINFNCPLHGNHQIEIRDMSGNLIRREKVNQDSKTILLRSSLKPGVYIISHYIDSQIVYLKKLIII